MLTPLQGLIGTGIIALILGIILGVVYGRRTALTYTDEDLDAEWDRGYRTGQGETEERFKREGLRERTEEYGYLPPPNLMKPRIWGPVDEPPTVVRGPWGPASHDAPIWAGSVTEMDETSPWLREQLATLAEWSRNQRRAIAS